MPSVTRASAVASAGQRKPRRNAPPRTRRRPKKPCARPDSNRLNPTRVAKNRGGAAAPHAVSKPAPPTPTSTAVRRAAGSVPSTRQPTGVRPPKYERPGSSRWSRTPTIHGSLALPLFLRKRGHDAPVIRPVGNHRLQEVPPIRWPNRSRDSRRGGTRRRVRAVGTLSGEDHRPVALSLQVQHGHHPDPNQHQRRPYRLRNVLPRRDSTTVGHDARRRCTQ